MNINRGNRKISMINSTGSLWFGKWISTICSSVYRYELAGFIHSLPWYFPFALNSKIEQEDEQQQHTQKKNARLCIDTGFVSVWMHSIACISFCSRIYMFIDLWIFRSFCCLNIPWMQHISRDSCGGKTIGTFKTDIFAFLYNVIRFLAL